MLIKDLMLMWETCVKVYDGFKKELFTLKTMLFGIINDFPVYGNLPGYRVKGKCACPICEGNANWTRLEYCLKECISWAS